MGAAVFDVRTSLGTDLGVDMSGVDWKSKPINKYTIGKAICDAIGINASVVTSLEIKLDGGTPRIEIVMPLFNDAGLRVADVLKQYNFVEKS